MTTHVGRDTLRKLRRLYFETWDREWPEPDSYLKTLWLESRELNSCTTAAVPPPVVWQDCLTSMRENHPFEVAKEPTQ